MQLEGGHAAVILYAAAPAGSDEVIANDPNNPATSRLIPTAVSAAEEPLACSLQEASDGGGGEQALDGSAECSPTGGIQQLATPGTEPQQQQLNSTAADPVLLAGSLGTQLNRDLPVASSSSSSLPQVVDIQQAVQDALAGSQELLEQRGTTLPLATSARSASLEADESHQTVALNREPASLTHAPKEAGETSSTFPQEEQQHRAQEQQHHAQQQQHPAPEQQQQEQMLLDETDQIPSDGNDLSMGQALPIPYTQARSRLSFEQVVRSAWRALLQYLPFVPRNADHTIASQQQQPAPSLPATPSAQLEAKVTPETSHSHQPEASVADSVWSNGQAGLESSEAAVAASQDGVYVAGAAHTAASAVDGDQQDFSHSASIPTSIGRHNANLHASLGEHQPQPSPSLPVEEDELNTSLGVAAALFELRHHSSDSAGVHATAMDAVQQVLALQHRVSAQLDSGRLSSQTAAHDSLLQLWLQQQALMAAAQNSSNQALALHVLIADMLVGQSGRISNVDTSQPTPLLVDPQQLHMPLVLTLGVDDNVAAADINGGKAMGVPVQKQQLHTNDSGQRDSHPDTTGPMTLQGGESALSWHQQEEVQQSGQDMSLPLEGQTAQGSEQPQAQIELTATGNSEPPAEGVAIEWEIGTLTQQEVHSSQLWYLMSFLILPCCLACLQTLTSNRAKARSAMHARTAVETLQAAHETHISELMSKTTVRFTTLHRRHAEQRVSDLQASRDADTRRSEERATEAGRLASSRQEVLQGLQRESDLSNSADADRNRFRTQLEGVQAVAAASVAAAVAEAAAADVRAGERQVLLQRAHEETVQGLGREVVRVRVALVFAQREVVRGTRAWLELRQTVDTKLKLLMGSMTAQVWGSEEEDESEPYSFFNLGST